MLSFSYILVALTALVASEKQSATGRVIAVRDADTIIVQFADWTFAVRPYLVDAPEAKGSRWPEQPFHREARQFTEQLCLHKQVTVTLHNFSFDRMVAKVSIDGEDWGQSLIAAGLAWYDDRYGVDDSLAQAEDVARDQRAGLWSDSRPTRPSAWRAKQRRAKSPPAKTKSARSLPIRVYQDEPWFWWWIPGPYLGREFSVPTDRWYQPPPLYSPDGFYVG